MYQIQTIKKDCAKHGVAGGPLVVSGGLWLSGAMPGCEAGKRINADNFGESNVAIATVCNADDRRCCTWALCVAAQRFAPARSEALHVPVHHALKPAQVREPRASRVYRNIS